MLDRSVCYEAQLGSDEDFQSVVIEGEGTLCCHFGGDAGARAAASAALSPALTSVPAIAPRSSRSLMMALRQSSLIFVVVRGLKAAAWVMELFALEAAFAGG